jgi:hypothetical protein
MPFAAVREAIKGLRGAVGSWDRSGIFKIFPRKRGKMGVY